MLFTDCKIVKGFKRSAIYDLGRNEFKFIPNSLADILVEFNRKTIQELLSAFSEEDQKIIKEYLDFFIENEYLQFCDSDELELFPELDLAYLNSGEINNAVISLSPITIKKLDETVAQLIDLGCKYLEVRNNYPMSISELSDCFNVFNNSPIKSINLITIYNTDYNIASIENFIEKNKRVVSTIVYNSTFNTFLEMKSIKFTKKGLNHLLLQKPSPKSFNINIRLYCESLNYNNYYNNKICIDEFGNCKNSIDNEKSFGNINDISLTDVLNVDNFKALWYIKKDDVQTCKDCEFRYMCVDTREPSRLNKNEWSFKSECNYNPYIGKWINEQDYISVKEFKEMNFVATN